jgi:cytochrome P450
MIAYSVYAMQRRTDLWAKDALSFRPERWEQNAKRGWEYLPFNGGPRICLGRKFHLYLMRPVITTRLIQSNTPPQKPAIRQ